MEYIRKIPLLMGTGAGLIIGLIGIGTGIPNKENMLNMCIGMVLFYIVGIVVRSTVKDIVEKVMTILMMKQKEEEMKKREEEQQRKKERLEQLRKGSSPASTIDLTIGDDSKTMDGDGFEDLPIAEFIRKEMK